MEKNINDRAVNRSAFGSLWNWLTWPHPSITDLARRRQAQLSSALALALAVFNLIGGIFTSQRSTQSIFQTFGVPALVSFIAYLATRSSFFSIGSFLLVIGFCASGFLNIITGNGEIHITILSYIPIALTVGSVLLSPWALVVLTGLNVGAVFLLPFFGIALPQDIGGILGLVAIFGIVLIIINYFKQNIEQEQLSELLKTNNEMLEIRTNLEERVEERTLALDRRSAQLEAAVLVTHAAAEAHDLKELLDNVTQQITARFGFYHTGIFLTDPSNQQVTLVAASSRGGQNMLARGHRLEIGREGIVGYVAYHKRPRIAQDVGVDTVFFNNPDLPDTHSEVALPMLVLTRLVGVLDIQSQEHNAFSSDDIYTLQTMTDQIALAIDNNRLIEQSRSAINNLETINADNTMKAWQEYLSEQLHGYNYTSLGVTPINKNDPTNNANQEKSFKIPLTLRGKDIGSISLTRKSNEASWTETEKEMASRVATQVVLVIENARLLESSQRHAIREQTLNNFSSRFSHSLDVDTLLQNAVRELHQLPQVSEVSVFINPLEETQKPV